MWLTTLASSTQVSTVALAYTLTGSIVNPGAEDGDMTGWTNNGMNARTTVARSSHVGSYHFSGGSTADADAFQALFPASLNAVVGTAVKSGMAYIEHSVWRRSLAGDDEGYMQLRTANALGSITGNVTGPWEAPSTWVERFLHSWGVIRDLPSQADWDTRIHEVRMHMYAERDDGTENNADFDDHEMLLHHVHSGPFWEDGFFRGSFQNLGGENSAVQGTLTQSVGDWQADSGFMVVSSYGDFSSVDSPILSAWVIGAGSGTPFQHVANVNPRSESHMAQHVFRAGKGNAWLWGGLFVAMNAVDDDTYTTWLRQVNVGSEVLQVSTSALVQRHTDFYGRPRFSAHAPQPFDVQTDRVQFGIGGPGGGVNEVYFDECQLRMTSQPELAFAYTDANSQWHPGYALNCGSISGDQEAEIQLKGSTTELIQFFTPQADGWCFDVELYLKHDAVTAESGWPNDFRVTVWECNSDDQYLSAVNTTNGWVPRAVGTLVPGSIATQGSFAWVKVPIGSLYISGNDQQKFEASSKAMGYGGMRYALMIDQEAASSLETSNGSGYLVLGRTTNWGLEATVAATSGSTRDAPGITGNSGFFAYGMVLRGDTAPSFPDHSIPRGVHAAVDHGTSIVQSHVAFTGNGAGITKVAMPFVAKGFTNTQSAGALWLKRAKATLVFSGTANLAMHCAIYNNSAGLPGSVVASASARGSASGWIVANSSSFADSNFLDGDAKGALLQPEWEFDHELVENGLYWMVVDVSSGPGTAWAHRSDARSITAETSHATFDGSWSLDSGAYVLGDVSFELSVADDFSPEVIVGPDVQSGNTRFPNDSMRDFPIWDLRTTPVL